MKTILVPSDFSTNATTAIKYAIQLSKILKYKLVVFNCVHESPFTLSKAQTETEMEQLIRKDEKENILKLKQQVEKAYNNSGMSGTPLSVKYIAEFNPLFVEKTIEVAKKNNSQLIVMGTHGASGIKKLFFGSNTSVMISKSEIPVLAVPEKYNYKEIKTLLYASDLENISTELNKVIAFAKILKAQINVLHIDYGLDSNDELLNKAKEVIKKNRYKNIKLTLKTADEKPLLKQIKGYLETHRQQCFVMFTKERSFWNKIIIGSKTEEMSTALALPLLSFKK